MDTFRNRNYIGLACSFHDPAFALVDSKGSVRFAEGVERRTQTKRAFNCPPDQFNSVAELITTYGDTEADLVISKSWSSPFGFYDWVWMLRGYTCNLATLRWLVPTHNRAVRMAGRNIEHIIRSGLVQNRSIKDRKLTFRGYDHHLTHAAAGCLTSPFNSAVCAVIDGAGEASSAAFFSFDNGMIKAIPAPRSVNSLGLFYNYLCEWCGFDSFKGEEWKVMGLAPFGSIHPSLERNLRLLIDARGLQLIYPTGRRQYNKVLQEMQCHARHPNASPMAAADLAYTGQSVYEATLTKLLNTLYRCYPQDNLVLAGGCALNSAYNGKITQLTPFKHVYVFSAPADDGNAVGSALLAYQEDHLGKVAHCPIITSPYLGSSLSGRILENIRTHETIPGAVIPEDLSVAVARLLAQGKVVAWARGKAEFGPRALGNRSILADPRDPSMKDRINAHVKFREAFRPLAPSILHEYGQEYFRDYVYSPYMERTQRFRPEKVAELPAVVHADGTGRVQSVTQVLNPAFYELIAAFHRLTGIPLLINTSLNVMGRPIAHSVEDVLGIFYGCGLDALVIEDVLIEKTANQNQ